jgi:hypothetical protein
VYTSTKPALNDFSKQPKLAGCLVGESMTHDKNSSNSYAQPHLCYTPVSTKLHHSHRLNSLTIPLGSNFSYRYKCKGIAVCLGDIISLVAIDQLSVNLRLRNVTSSCMNRVAPCVLNPNITLPLQQLSNACVPSNTMSLSMPPASQTPNCHTAC